MDHIDLIDRFYMHIFTFLKLRTLLSFDLLALYITASLYLLKI